MAYTGNVAGVHNSNFATAERARDRRNRLVAEGKIDPMQAAQSNYAGPGWDAFFGSLRELGESADAAGMRFKVGAIGSEGLGMPARQSRVGSLAVGGGEWNPLEQQAIKDAIRARAASEAGDDAFAAKAMQKEYADAQQANILGSLRGGYDEHLIGQAFAMPEEQTIVERSAQGVSARPAAQMGDRERQLRMAPPHLRPALLKQYAEMDAKAQTAEAAMVKARADEKRANAGDTTSALVAVMGPDGKPVLVPRAQAVGMQPASSREQGRQVTSGDVGRIADLDTSLDDLRTLTETLGTTGAGSKVGAMLPNVVTEITGWGMDSKARQGTIDRVKQVIGKALEGGVLRKEDEIKYEKILPTIGDPPPVAKAKLEGLQRALIQRRQTFLDDLSSANYDTSGFAARPAVGGSGGGPVPMVAPDGRPLMVPADKVAAMEAAGAKRQ